MLYGGGLLPFLLSGHAHLRDNFAGAQQAIPRCVVSRCDSLVGEPGRSAAVPISMPSLQAEIPTGCDRDGELKRRVDLWEAGEVQGLIATILGEQHTGCFAK